MKNQEKKIRILYFVKSFSPISETFVYDQVKGISQWAEVLVVCLRRENQAIFPFDAVQEIPIQERSFKERFKRKLFKQNIYLNFSHPKFKASLKTILDQFQPQLIHCHFGIQALRLTDNLQDFSIPVIITFHGYDASQYLKLYPVYRAKLRKLFKRKNIFPLSVSKAIQQNLIDHQIDSPHHKVLYNGIDPNFFKREKTAATPFTFLQIARLTEKKGSIYTLLAFKKLISQFPDFKGRLIMAGDGPLRQSLLENIQQLGLSDFVDLQGSINRTGVRKLMSTANVFVQHSIRAANGDTEGLPMTIMEAMAMELPILSTVHAGIPELVEHTVNGFLVEEKEVDAYARYMKEISTWAYAKKNRAKIIDQFSLDVHLREVMKFYKMILKLT